MKIKTSPKIENLNDRRLFETSTNGILILNMDTGRISDVNPFLVQLLGFSRSEMLGKTVGELSPFQDIESNQVMLERLQKDGYVRYEDLPLETRDGRHIAVEFISNVYQAGDEKVIQCNVRDISERKLIEETLEHSQHLLAESEKIGKVGSWELDVATQHLTWTEMVYHIHELESTRPPTLEQAVDFYSPSSRPIIERAVRRAIELGEPFDLELQIITAKGNRREVHAIGHTDPARGKVYGFFQDITERKQAEQALANERALLRTLVDNLPVAVYLKDLAGRKTLSNPVDLQNMGLTSEAEVLGKADYDLFSPEEAAVFHADDQQVLRTGQPVINHEEKLTRPDGSILWLLTSKVPVFDHAGQVTGLAGIGLNITERRMLENRMQQTQKMEAIGTLAGGIAHDFNNMLAAMFGFCYLLEQDTQGNSAAQDSIAEIFKAANRAKELVQQILTFSRQREQKREVVWLEPIVKEATKLLRASLPAQIKIESSFAADTPAVLADPTQVYQVTMNLATNALHAMEDRPGTLTVKLESFEPEKNFLHVHPEFHPGQYARLTVADTGYGMNAKTLERIFEPFFTTKPTGKGTGLGLAVVHGIIQAHEGLITVESQIGRGTTFCVYFPAQSTDAAAIKAPADKVPRGQGENLLLVDDEPALTKSLQHLLSRLHYQVTTSNSAREAIRLFQQDPARFDLVITDLAMPEMNGLNVARQLHVLRPDLPVLLASGFTSDLTPENLREAGIYEVVEKPVSMIVLADVVQRALAGQNRHAAASNDKMPG